MNSHQEGNNRHGYNSIALEQYKSIPGWKVGQRKTALLRNKVQSEGRYLQNAPKSALTENFKQISCTLFPSDCPCFCGQLRWIRTYMGKLTSWGFLLYFGWVCFSLPSLFSSSSDFFSFRCRLYIFFPPQTNHLQVHFGMKTDCPLSSSSACDRWWQNPWKTPDSTGVMITKWDMTTYIEMNCDKGTFA